MKFAVSSSQVLLLRCVILMTLLLLFTSEGKRLRRNDAAAGKGQHESRIHGGKEPPEGKYPSLARIEHFQNGAYTGWFLWGVATILNRDWILTSGSMFSREYYAVVNVSRLRFIVGDSSINNSEPYEQIVGVERFMIHEKFHSGLWVNNLQTAFDIAVAKVTPPIKFSSRVTAVNLPTTCDESELGTGWVPGWGAYTKTPGQPYVDIDKLVEIHNPVITTDECNKRIRDFGSTITLTDLVTCTRAEQNKSVCLGDWGSPLFLIKNESYMVQIGIMSLRPAYYVECGTEDNVGAFTRVSKYLGWIHRRISGCGNHRFHNITKVYEGKN